MNTLKTLALSTLLTIGLTGTVLAHDQDRGPDFDRMADKLELTQEQRDAFIDIMKGQHEKRQAIMDSTREQMKALDDETRARLKNVLTEEQLARMERRRRGMDEGCDGPRREHMGERMGDHGPRWHD
ncbi:Spy/CpxP family protein refolding chaperone [Hahella sp. SMD15-11]|uniref:Spy/CpxP family protein refolding chaperone n=1 Tax=Thermohahella caldifontis TaxID=3142973 RepID=A0AB39USN7_9GAMM